MSEWPWSGDRVVFEKDDRVYFEGLRGTIIEVHDMKTLMSRAGEAKPSELRLRRYVVRFDNGRQEWFYGIELNHVCAVERLAELE